MRLFHITSLICLIVWKGSAQSSTDNVQSVNSEAITAYHTGSLHLHGNNGMPDYQRSYNEFSFGANEGYAASNYALGYMHFKGLGVDQNYNMAVTYFERAAEAGIAEANMMLGSCYYHGVGKEENIDSALYHLRKASIAGSTQAYSIYNRIVELGGWSYSFLPRKPLISSANQALISDQYEIPSHEEKNLSFEGDWEGLWVTYDWSGRMVMDKAAVQLSAFKIGKTSHFKIRFLDSDLDLFQRQTCNIQANTLNASGNYEKRAFTGELRTWNITKIDSHLKLENNGKLLQLNIQSYNAETSEPSQPISIFLRPDTQSDSDLKVYPNPSKESFTIQFNLLVATKASINVYSLDGKEMIRMPEEYFNQGANQRPIKLPATISRGIYMLKIENDEFVKSTLIIKK